VLGPGTRNLVIAMTIYLVPRLLRLTRASVLETIHRTYVRRAVAVGCTTPRILLRHVLPNCAAPLVVQLTYDMGSVAMLAAGLSFLGLGPARPNPEWGVMLSDGRAYLLTSPLEVIVPGIALFGLIAACNLLGDGLRDILDPASSAHTRAPSQKLWHLRAEALR